MRDKVIDTALLSTAYFAPIEYFAVIASSNNVLIEREEFYQKQSYRTRCHIPSGNGLLVLNVPVLRDVALGHKVPIKEIKVDYTKEWITQHKRGLEAAYHSSPFFEYYVDDIYSLLDKKHKYLIDLNTSLTELILELLNIDNNISFTAEYNHIAQPINSHIYSCSANIGDNEILNLRDRIHPKSKECSMLELFKKEKPYYQVFNHKQGFISNLSILDLLCNEGPNSISFLKL